MKLNLETEWDRILVKTSGLALLTVALTWIPQAFGALVRIVTIIFVSRTTSHSGDKLDEMLETYNMQMTSNAVGEFLAFIILVGIARWIINYPKFLQRWLAQPPQEGKESKEQNKSCEATGDNVSC